MLYEGDWIRKIGMALSLNYTATSTKGGPTFFLKARVVNHAALPCSSGHACAAGTGTRNVRLHGCGMRCQTPRHPKQGPQGPLERAILDARVLVRGDEACALRGWYDDKRLSRLRARKIDFATETSLIALDFLHGGATALTRRCSSVLSGAAVGGRLGGEPSRNKRDP